MSINWSLRLISDQMQIMFRNCDPRIASHAIQQLIRLNDNWSMDATQLRNQRNHQTTNSYLRSEQKRHWEFEGVFPSPTGESTTGMSFGTTRSFSLPCHVYLLCPLLSPLLFLYHQNITHVHVTPSQSLEDTCDDSPEGFGTFLLICIHLNC